MRRFDRVVLSLTLILSTFGVLTTGCARSEQPDEDDPQQTITQAPMRALKWDQQRECDAFRVLGRRKVLNNLRFKAFVDHARQLSSAFTSEEIAQMKTIIPELNHFELNSTSPSLNPFLTSLHEIFETARARSGMTEGEGETFEPSIVEGNSELFEVGQVSGAEDVLAVHLLAPADQSRYELRLEQATEEPQATVKHLTLLEYINRHLPPRCSGVASGLKSETINSIQGI